jgi:hypothetical protein
MDQLCILRVRARNGEYAMVSTSEVNRCILPACIDIVEAFAACNWPVMLLLW